ncbi:G-D-S-L family lipolytic protein [Lentilactobacillus otakiensis DSM 19908 = JCM 15040]|nr:G-D-S-L family lipolytic protein [Lentilactobacillus otakiensis DSM 19908 = JCM 15040]
MSPRLQSKFNIVFWGENSMINFFNRHIKLFFAALVVASISFGVYSHPTADKAGVQVEYTTQALPHAFALKKNAKLYTDVHLAKSVSSKKYAKSAWYRSQTAKLIYGGKTKVVYRITSTDHKHTFWVLNSQVKNITSKSYNVKLASADNKFTGDKIGVFGDSIPAGWDGYHFYMNSSYPDWMAKYLGTNTKVENFACPSGRIVGHRYAYLGTTLVPQDLSAAIKAHRTAIKHMNMIFVHIGTNDYTNYSGSGSLKNVMHNLRYNIRMIQKLNPNAKIYGVLPISRYDANGLSRENMSDMYGYTFKDLRVAEAKLYKSLGATVINFNQFAPGIITSQNKNYTLRDHEIHPTAQTAQKMGLALAKELAK